MEINQKRQTIFKILDEIEEELQKHPDTIPEHVFHTLEGICKMVYAWKHPGEGKDGWSRKLGYFSPEESKILEAKFEGFSQTGGATEEAEFKKLFSQFQSLVGDIGTQWKEITSSLGIIATNTLQKYVPLDSKSLEEIRTNPETQRNASGQILLFFSGLVEALRLWVAMSSVDSATYRVFLSLSQGILDMIRGDVRQAIFSSIGLFGQGGYYISVITHFFVSVIEFVSPDLRSQMEFDIYKNLKTLSAAGLLWSYYTFAPETLKYNINSVFREIQDLGKQEGISLGRLEAEVRKVAKQQNLELPDIPLTLVPSYEDLQTFGTLLKQPEIACLPIFQKLLVPLRSVFTLRLTLDLFDIPTGQIELEDLCLRQKSQTRKATPQKGGKKRGKKTRKFESTD
jgi:hypothetical protein